MEKSFKTSATHKVKFTDDFKWAEQGFRIFDFKKGDELRVPRLCFDIAKANGFIDENVEPDVGGTDAAKPEEAKAEAEAEAKAKADAEAKAKAANK